MINLLSLQHSINQISLVNNSNHPNNAFIRPQFSFLKDFKTPDQDFRCSKLTESRAAHNHLYFMDFYSNFPKIKVSKTKISDFHYLSQIGQGGYGVVYLCSKNSGEIMALKKMNKKILFLQEEIIHSKTERELLEKSRSEWLVKLYHAFQDEEHIYLAMVTYLFKK
jgi:hypothetical protein